MRFPALPRTVYKQRLVVAALVALAIWPAAARAEDPEVPYWASIRADELNMRVGPGEEYRIAWVYRRVGLPLKVLRTMSGWRLVEEVDGTRGWVVARFLTRDRTAIVKGRTTAPMRDAASASAALKWELAPGVVGRLGDCADGWCRLAVGQRDGFVEQARLWGAGEP